jgi:hypothetical protein
MKLVLCRKCQDIFKLDFNLRRCKCEECWGKYLPDGLNAIYGGIYAVPLGMANGSLVDAVKEQPAMGLGKKFEAFVIPRQCDTMKRMEKPPSDEGKARSKEAEPSGSIIWFEAEPE